MEEKKKIWKREEIPVEHTWATEDLDVSDEAWEAVVRQIDAGFPVPILVLRHKDPELKDFVWHWFLLIGYSDEESEETPRRHVKAVTYGEWAWVDFDRLWDTGYEQKGGLVLYRWDE